MSIPPLNSSEATDVFSHGAPGINDEHLIRIFNTAVISTHTKTAETLSKDLAGIMKSPAFHAILAATRQLAQQTGLPEKEAAEALIQTFRKMDQIWHEYVYVEGVAALKSSR